jgi:hypothetical protein
MARHHQTTVTIYTFCQTTSVLIRQCHPTTVTGAITITGTLKLIIKQLTYTLVI